MNANDTKYLKKLLYEGIGGELAAAYGKSFGRHRVVGKSHPPQATYFPLDA